MAGAAAASCGKTSGLMRSRLRTAKGWPETTYSHRLMRLVNLIAKPFFARYAEQKDLSINEWRVVMLLAAHPGMSASEIAERSGMILMNVSRAVRRLVRMRRIARMVDPADGRRAQLTLTARGRALFDQIAPKARRSEDAVRALLEPGEAAEFSRLLDKLLDGITLRGSNDSA